MRQLRSNTRGPLTLFSMRPFKHRPAHARSRRRPTTWRPLHALFPERINTAAPAVRMDCQNSVMAFSVDLLSPAVKTQEMPLTHALVVSHRRSSTMPPMQNRDGCGMLRRASVWQSRSAACDACGPPLPAVALAVWAALT